VQLASAAAACASAGTAPASGTAAAATAAARAGLALALQAVGTNVAHRGFHRVGLATLATYITAAAWVTA
jgi:hypothetical protein